MRKYINTCSSMCEYYKDCPVGFNRVEFEFEDVKFSCECVNKLFDKFVEVKEFRNEEKKQTISKSLSYFG